MRTECTCRAVTREPYNRDCAYANGCSVVAEGLDVVMHRSLLHPAMFFWWAGGKGGNFNGLHSRILNTQWLAAFGRQPALGGRGGECCDWAEFGQCPVFKLYRGIHLTTQEIYGEGVLELEYGSRKILCVFRSVNVADSYGWSVITVPFCLPKVQHVDRCVKLPHFQIS